MSRHAPRVVVIADDLTGANDTGLQVAKRGIATITLLGVAPLDRGLSVGAGAPGIVLDTESRSLSPGGARQVVRDGARALMRSSFDPERTLLYKKIDSTLRGHIGAELDELIRAYAPDSVICAPAYPARGRTTRDGLQLLRGVRLDRTPLADDPRNPVGTASLAGVLESDGGPQVHHVPLGLLRSGGGELAATVAAHRYLSFDCVDDEDLQRIVESALGARRRQGERILWCGSAGLAGALMGRAFPSTQADANPAGAGEAVEDPLLFVVGSASEVSGKQAQALETARGAAVVSLDPSDLAAARKIECDRAASALEAGAASGRLLILSVSSRGKTVQPAAGRPELIGGRLAEVVAELLRRRRIGGLFLTGGETAYRVLDRLGVRGVRIEAEVEAGVPGVRFVGGVVDGLRGVTKAGAFGDSQTMVRAARYLGQGGFPER